MASTSALLNKPLRRHVVPILREAGFQQVDRRNAWSWRDDLIWVFNVRAVGTYFSIVNLRRLLLAAVLLAAVGCVHAGRPARHNPAAIDRPVRLDGAPPTADAAALPLVYWTERRQGPEPVAIHVLRVDLRDPVLGIVSMIADDPDAEGPAEAVLTKPAELARNGHALAAVNANAFAGLPDAAGKRDERWREGLPVDICGLAVHRGVWRSRAQKDSVINLSFGIDRGGKPFIGPAPDERKDIAEAVNAWSADLVDDGHPIPQPGGARHPRTALGFDKSRRWLYLVVVDGRQPGYSIGMTARELAELMVRLGSHRAVNLDGGGSSVLLVAGQDDNLGIINRPSGGEPRPVPVLLGVRQKTEQGDEGKRDSTRPRTTERDPSLGLAVSPHGRSDRPAAPGRKIPGAVQDVRIRVS